jgi:uncharacterized membrane protein YqjE
MEPRFDKIDAELRLHRWMIGTAILLVLGVYPVLWHIIQRLPT